MLVVRVSHWPYPLEYGPPSKRDLCDDHTISNPIAAREAYQNMVDTFEPNFEQKAKSFKGNRNAAKRYLREMLSRRGLDISGLQASDILHNAKDTVDTGGADNVRIGSDGSIFGPNKQLIADAEDPISGDL